MAADNQLNARFPASHIEHIEDYANHEGIADTEAQRRVVKEGLAALDYVDRPTDGVNLFTWYLHRIGLTLGLVGLILMGYGVWGVRVFSVTGFGLLLAGFLFIVLEAVLDHFEGRGR